MLPGDVIRLIYKAWAAAMNNYSWRVEEVRLSSGGGAVSSTKDGTEAVHLLVCTPTPAGWRR